MSDKTVKLNVNDLIMLEKEHMKRYPRLTKLLKDNFFPGDQVAAENIAIMLNHSVFRRSMKGVIKSAFINRHVLKKLGVPEIAKMDPFAAFAAATMLGYKSPQPNGDHRNPMDADFVWPHTAKPSGAVRVHVPKERPQNVNNHFTYNPDLRILE